MIVIGFDPGVTTGWAGFETKKEGDKVMPAAMVGYGQVRFEELIANIEAEPRLHGADVVVIEYFKLLPHKAQKMIGSQFETIQAIGVIKSWAKRHGAQVVEQSPGIKPLAQKQTQIFPPSKHSESHWVDAVNHAKYWMIKSGLDLTELQKRGGKP